MRFSCRAIPARERRPSKQVSSMVSQSGSSTFTLQQILTSSLVAFAKLLRTCRRLLLKDAIPTLVSTHSSRRNRSVGRQCPAKSFSRRCCVGVPSLKWSEQLSCVKLTWLTGTQQVLLPRIRCRWIWRTDVLVPGSFALFAFAFAFAVAGVPTLRRMMKAFAAFNADHLAAGEALEPAGHCGETPTPVPCAAELRTPSEGRRQLPGQAPPLERLWRADRRVSSTGPSGWPGCRSLASA